MRLGIDHAQALEGGVLGEGVADRVVLPLDISVDPVLGEVELLAPAFPLGSLTQGGGDGHEGAVRLVGGSRAGNLEDGGGEIDEGMDRVLIDKTNGDVGTAHDWG